jgi:GTP-binding protein
MPRRRRFEDGLSHDDAALPAVSLIGRPNVGKSSLFNRLVGGRPALVEDRPGVTRDRRYGIVEWNGARFRIIDTGGLDPSADGILGAMRGQTLRAAEEAAVLLFVVDGRDGVSGVDRDVARLLRKSGKPVVVAANKIDPGARDAYLADVFGLGFETLHPISATHGRGVGTLLDTLVELLGEGARPSRPRVTDLEALSSEAPTVDDQDSDDASDEDADPARPIRIAFVGKPNVGKSSLVNRLLGEERVLVHDVPGTTVDPIDTPFRVGDREFVLVDTAGLRRRRTVESYTEAISAKMARDQLARADVVALVIDARQGATAEDAKLASFIEESGRAALLVLNKVDLVSRSAIEARVKASRDELGFFAHVPVLLTSAVTGRGAAEIPAQAVRVFTAWSTRIATGELNRHFEEMVTRRPAPAGPGGRHVKLYYITQAATRPPTFYVSTNQPAAIGYAYRRYLVNQIRKTYPFEGSPLRLTFRGRGRKKGDFGPRGAGHRAGAASDAGPDLD